MNNLYETYACPTCKNYKGVDGKCFNSFACKGILYYEPKDSTPITTSTSTKPITKEKEEKIKIGQQIQKVDNVNHPSHYCTGNIEVIKYIEDKFTKEEFVAYCLGNVIKYVSRWKHKGGKEDLEKAQVYLKFALNRLNK